MATHFKLLCAAAAGLIAVTHAFAPHHPRRVLGGVSRYLSTAPLAANSVLVVGSVNADIVVSIPRLPAPGEPLLGSGGQVGICVWISLYLKKYMQRYSERYLL